MNLYTYCRNNPIRYIDPSGHDAVEAAAFKYNNPRSTHINSAWDAKQLQKWDNKFNDLLNSAPKINSQYDVTLYNNLRNKFTAPPSFKVNSNSDANYYKQRMDMYKTWKSIVGQAPLTKSGVSWKVPGTVVSNNESHIKSLDVRMQPLARDFLINSNQAGYALAIWESFRTREMADTHYQNYLDALNAGQDPATLSYSVPGTTRHEFGQAFDVRFWNYDTNSMDNDYDRAGYYDQFAVLEQFAPYDLGWGGKYYNDEPEFFLITDHSNPTYKDFLN